MVEVTEFTLTSNLTGFSCSVSIMPQKMALEKRKKYTNTPCNIHDSYKKALMKHCSLILFIVMSFVGEARKDQHHFWVPTPEWTN